MSWTWASCASVCSCSSGNIVRFMRGRGSQLLYHLGWRASGRRRLLDLGVVSQQQTAG